MNILGINFAFHDSSACVVKNGELIVAIEEERLTRDKHTMDFPYRAVERCLEMAGLDVEEVDTIAFSIDPKLHLMTKALYGFKCLHKAIPFYKHEFLWAFFRQRTIKSWYRSLWGNKSRKPKIEWVSHHMAHVAGTFFVSPYEEAALLSIDGSGEWATSFLGYGKGTEITEYTQSFFPHSLGSMYEAVTAFCGFKPMYDEGKTMGLAPLGDPDRYYKEASEVVQVTDEGNIILDHSYFGFQCWDHNYLTPKFHQVFGQQRQPDEEFQQNHLDTAAAFQRVLEDASLKMCAALRRKTDAKHLVIAGGVALNSVMNGRIVRETDFDDVYVMPAAGDNGTAIGAAYYVHHITHGNSRCFEHNNPYLGTRYDNEQLADIIQECKLNAVYHEEIEAETAKLLAEGNIICWFQGAMEIGPRALGNRSILADPTQPHMKDKINAEVKHREAYRPFAPSVPAEHLKEYFDIEVEAPFMLKVCDVLEEKKSVLPAITHVDGSARVQSVRKEINPRYHKLMTEFGKLSGVPVVLNTSFNIMGEPIVESPYDAIRCFFSTGLDYLVLGNYVIGK